SSPALIYYKDTQHRYIRVNKMFADIIGLPISEIIGKTYSELFPHKNDHGYEADLKVIRNEEPILNKTALLETTTETREIRIDKIPYKNTKGEVIGIIGFAQDITDLKRAESEKKELEEQLSQAQKLESIGVLAGGIAHDFNNVMAIVSGAAQMLEMKVQDSSLQPYLDMITSSITRGKSITDRLLTFARAESMEFQILSANKSLESTYELASHTLSKDIDIEVIPYDGNDLITGDPAYLQQVLLNICINAADAMPEGGNLTLGLGEAPESMVRQYQPESDYDFLCISVTDTGHGIGKESLERIFEPFYTTKEPGKGTGLGLSVAYKIMQQHHGWIDVQSEVNEGSTVNLGIPRAPEYAKTEEVSDFIESSLGSGENILLVDDEESLRNLLCERLRMHGYHIDVAANGEDALRICKETNGDLDLIITDIKMPKIGGISLQKHLKELMPHVPTVAITGIVERHKLEEAGGLQFDAILQKPLNISELLETVRRVLEQNRSQE
ncbi:MAG TPA: ATP-binding protein, partial [bacterium]|nr:ATP-binding protein [bacterium]